VKLCSMEYMEEVKQRTNADAEYRRLAKTDTDSYTMILTAEPEKGVPETIVAGYDLVNGEITEVWLGQRKTSFTLAGPYGVWVDVLRGATSPDKALTMRKLKVSGNILRLLKGADSTIRWVEILRTIPTEFAGDYARYNMPGA